MTTSEFRSLLALFMCSNPWPTNDPLDYDRIEVFLDETAKDFGFSDWLQAYHEL